MTEADLKTLKLANAAPTDEAISRFIEYQRALLAEHAGHSEASGWEGRMAFAHSAALRASGLEVGQLGALSAVASDFCAKRGAARELAGRREEAERRIAEAKGQGRAPPEREAAVLAGIAKETARLEDLRPLEDRYGADTVAKLRAREDELLELHRAVTRLAGGGHLHRP